MRGHKDGCPCKRCTALRLVVGSIGPAPEVLALSDDARRDLASDFFRIIVVSFDDLEVARLRGANDLLRSNA